MNDTYCFTYNSSLSGGDGGILIPVPCNNIVGSDNLFSPGVSFTQYGYNQVAWVVYLFTALNALAIAAHLGLGIYWRTFWTLPTLAAGAAVETIGWAGRIWSLQSEVWNPNFGGVWYSNYNGFLMQIICLVIGPTFFSAANYVLLNRLIRATGGRYSSITPESFTLMFVVADIACLVVQGVGGGIAGSANTVNAANNGAYIMTGGVCLQLLITVVFVVLYLEFIWRYRTGKTAPKQYDVAAWAKCGAARRRSREARKLYAAASSSSLSSVNGVSKMESGGSAQSMPTSNNGRIWAMTWVLGFATLLITIRGVFRSVELTNGWRGPIATNQPLFLALDPLLMTILVFVYVVYHPGFALGRTR